MRRRPSAVRTRPGTCARTARQGSTRSGIAVGSRLHTIGCLSLTPPAASLRWRERIVLCEAGAAAATGPIKHRSIKPYRCRLKFRGARRSTRNAAGARTTSPTAADAGLRGVRLVGHQVMEPSLHRPAPLTVPDTHQAVDLIERTAELLSPGDEGETAGDLVNTVVPLRANGGATRRRLRCSAAPTR